ncbi:hypothetical protein HY745_08505, partial [Candidatus Desantisbacteria bacterium]|nr:hypothetical protein [Candidatus Desantisbacteria bacterium]
KTISYELAEKEIFPDAIFLCPTSASTLVGMGRAYQYLKEKYKIKIPQIHAVQYGNITSLAGKCEVSNVRNDFLLKDNTSVNVNNKIFKNGNLSFKNRLGTKNTSREKEALEIINKTGGSGWIVSNQEIKNAAFILTNNGIITSIEGNAVFAGMIKASEKQNFKEPL